jgi:RNA-binding protein PNO1
MNTKKKSVELRTSQFTEEKTSLQRGADFIKAFLMGM